MPIVEITDCTRPELSEYTALTHAQLRRMTDAPHGVFIAESPAVIEAALAAGCRPRSFLMEQRQTEGKAKPLLAQCPDVPVYTAPRTVLEGLTGFALTRGILCAMERPAPCTAEEVCRGAHRIAVLEDIVDAENVGAIFRSAAALGVDAVLVTPSCIDPLTRRVLRVSMGSVFRVPWAVIGNRQADWRADGVNRLKALGFTTAALALRPDSLPLDDERLSHTERLALLLGTEGTGLCEETLRACDHSVIIPMAHGVDSLNVGAAAAVAFWQLCLI